MSSPRELVKVKMLFAQLTKESLVAFPKAGKPLAAPNEQEVYIIYDARRRVQHVGKTVRGKKGLRQRLNNHLQGQSSFVIKALKSKGAKLRNGYKFRCLVVSDSRLRALLEFYALAHLCPAHIGLGEIG